MKKHKFVDTMHCEKCFDKACHNMLDRPHQPTPVLVRADQLEYVKESGVAIGLLKYYLARISKPNKNQ